MQKPTEPSIPVETPVPTEEPTPTPEPTPTATPVPTEEPTADTSGKYEVSPGVYNDGTTRELTPEEMDNMTIEEKRAYSDANSKKLGARTEDETQEVGKEAMENFNLDNPYIQDIIDSGVLNN